MKTSDIIIGVLVLMLLSRPKPTLAQRLGNPATWGADFESDQWARLYGEDLKNAGGQHSAPSAYDIYGIKGGLGFPGILDSPINVDANLILY